MSAKMYALIEDNVEKFYTIADEKIGECEIFAQFVDEMKKHSDLLMGSDDEDHLEDCLHDMWNVKWSKYL